MGVAPTSSPSPYLHKVTRSHDHFEVSDWSHNHIHKHSKSWDHFEVMWLVTWPHTKAHHRHSTSWDQGQASQRIRAGLKPCSACHLVWCTRKEVGLSWGHQTWRDGYSTLLPMIMVTWEHVMVTWAHVMVTWTHVMVTWAHVMVTWAHVMVTWAYVMVTWAYVMVTWASVVNSFAGNSALLCHSYMY